MDDTDDLQNPDQSRSPKRMRLDAPLEVTKQLQQEIANNAEDEDWDDIYGDSNDSIPVCNAPASISTLQDIKPEQNEVDTSGFAAPICAAPSTSEKLQSGVTDVVKTEEQSRHEDVPMDGVPQDAIDDGSNDLVAPKSEAAKDGTDKASTDVMEETTDVEFRPDLMTNFLAVGTAQKGETSAEWELDSSPEDSSDSSDSDTSSDDSSDDSDSGSADGYELMDPATAAKMLMSGDGEDDDADKPAKKRTEHVPKTQNEQDEEVIMPDIELTTNDKITLLGTVVTIVKNMITIKGVISGEYQALEIGSVVCNEDYRVIGAIADTFGPVREPFYIVRFNNQEEIDNANLADGSEIFYVNKASTFVFTAPLKTMKGTDASNFYDEEIREDEAEFSDDEKEAEFKRLRKSSKKAGTGTLTRGDYEELSRNGGLRQTSPHLPRDVPTHSYGSGMSYDDQPAEEFYQPLRRPDNLPHLMGSDSLPPRPQFLDRGGRGGGAGRGRADRGRGRGGDRGRGRSDFHQRGGRGGRAGGGNQQSSQAHRGNAQSFPDRHNGPDNGNRQPPASFGNVQAQPAFVAPSQSYQQQTYQFNGQNYQFGYPPAATSNQFNAYGQQQAQLQQQYQQYPAGHPPSSSYGNSAYYQAPQQPLQNQGYNHTYAQQHAQPQAPAYGAPYQSATHQQQQVPPANIDISSILTRLTGPQPPPPPSRN